jgi:hypothetical protein
MARYAIVFVVEVGSPARARGAHPPADDPELQEALGLLFRGRLERVALRRLKDLPGRAAKSVALVRPAA